MKIKLQNHPNCAACLYSDHTQSLKYVSPTNNTEAEQNKTAEAAFTVAFPIRRIQNEGGVTDLTEQVRRGTLTIRIIVSLLLDKASPSD